MENIALLFDLDGTLVDSIQDLCDALNKTRRFYNLKNLPLETIKNIIGKGFPTTIKKVLSFDFDDEKIKSIFMEAYSLTKKNYLEVCGTNTKIYDGVIETLEKLYKLNYKMVVVTNKEENHAYLLLEKIGMLKYFVGVVGGDTTPKYKPSPDAILFALQALNIKKDKSIMIGDSENDILAAKNAGIKSIAVTYGYNHNQDINEFEPNLVIENFNEINNQVIENLLKV